MTRARLINKGGRFVFPVGDADHPVISTVHLSEEEAPMGKKSSKGRVKIQLECTTCRESEVPGVSRYPTTKNKKKTPGRIEFSKYCRFERKHTLHREVK